MDKYTKAVLTVIAVCLVLLTTKEVVIEPVNALNSVDVRLQIEKCLDRADVIGDIWGGNTIEATLRTRC